MEDTEKITAALNRFTVRDGVTVQRLAQDELSGRDFFIQLIESKLSTTDIVTDVLHTWTDTNLYVVVLDWFIKSKITPESTDEPSSLDRLRDLLLDRAAKLREQTQFMADLNRRELSRFAKEAQEVARFMQPPDKQVLRIFAEQASAIQDAMKYFRASDYGLAPPPNLVLDRTFMSNVLEAARIRAEELNMMQSRIAEATLARSVLLDATRLSAQVSLAALGEQVKSIAQLSADSFGAQPSIKMLAEQMRPVGAMLRAAEMSTFAQSSLARLQLENLGAVVGLGGIYRQTIAAQLADVALAYADHVRSIQVPTVDITTISPILIEPPAREIFTTTEFVEIITVEQVDDEIAEERREERTELALQTQDVLHNLLSEIDPRFVNMLDGATQALVSTNVDRVRHFTVSFRELFTHIIHTLAPDNAIRLWTNDPEHFENKRPTRKARLLYICRRVNHPPLNQFFQKDIAAALELLDVFQGGTHGLEVNLNSEQLLVLKLRMESTLRFILEVNRINEQS